MTYFSNLYKKFVVYTDGHLTEVDGTTEREVVSVWEICAVPQKKSFLPVLLQLDRMFNHRV